CQDLVPSVLVNIGQVLGSADNGIGPVDDPVVIDPVCIEAFKGSIIPQAGTPQEPAVQGNFSGYSGPQVALGLQDQRNGSVEPVVLINGPVKGIKTHNSRFQAFRGTVKEFNRGVGQEFIFQEILFAGATEHYCNKDYKKSFR